MSKEALLSAVQNGDVEAARAALEGEGGADARDTQGRTILMLACLAGDTAMVRALLDGGASPNRRTPVHEETALHLLAKQQGSATVARELLKQRVRINRLDRYGWSPLMVAIRNEHSELVDVLVESGADTSLSLPDGRSAKQLADELGVALG